MRELIKQTLFTLAAIVVLPFTLSYLLLSQLINKDALLAGYSQLLSLLPGKTGSYLRAGFYRFTLTYCSPDAVISFGTLFSQQDTEIGKGVYIGPQCNIGRCKIGENSLIGSGVHIMSGKGQHNFDDPETPIKDQGGHYEKIEIGENCWFGNCALIMSSIGNNTVVGAGSVVAQDMAEGVIVVGNPAKVVKSRQ